MKEKKLYILSIITYNWVVQMAVCLCQNVLDQNKGTPSSLSQLQQQAAPGIRKSISHTNRVIELNAPSFHQSVTPELLHLKAAWEHRT